MQSRPAQQSGKQPQRLRPPRHHCKVEFTAFNQTLKGLAQTDLRLEFDSRVFSVYAAFP